MKRSAIALARGARIGVLEHLGIDGGVDGVERGGELGVAIADEESEASAGVVEVHEQVAGLLGDPGAGGVRGDPGDVDAAAAVLDGHEPVGGAGRPCRRARSRSKDGVGLRGEELAPGRSRPL